jgi:hypothetical protein
MLKSALLCVLVTAGLTGVASAQTSDVPVIPEGPQAGSVVPAGTEVLDLSARAASAPWQKRNFRATERWCSRRRPWVLSFQVCGVSVHTASRVQQGVQYRITVTGAWNAWSHPKAARGCGAFQDKDGILASADPGFTFGTRSRPLKCRKLDWSAGFRPGSTFVFSGDNGRTYQHPSFEGSPASPQASYSFLVTGRNNRDHLFFAIGDFGGVTDNVGGATITVQPLPPT